METIKAIAIGVLKSLAGKFAITGGGLIAIIATLLIVIITAVIAGGHDDIGSGPVVTGEGKELPESVLIWEDDVADALEKHDMDEKYLYVLLAIMKQESNGDVAATNGDIFQSSESKCGSIGCITDPLESIDQAVVHFKNTIDAANGNMEVAIASYNFGNGFASWTQENHDNEWSVDIAIEFSQHMMTKVSDPENYTCIRKEAEPYGACYGDILYVPTITAYVPEYQGEGESGGDTDFDGGDFDGEFELPVAPAIVTSEFGSRTHPVTGEEESFHKGIDFGCSGGLTNITSVEGGVVVYADWSNGYGNTVIIQHDDNLYTHYAHMSSINVSQDDDVQQGEEVGICGSTGQSTGPHLHFEVKEYMWEGHQEPRDYLPNLN